ncbi:hypothetical protein B5F71_18245 [Bacteroides sp. An269]|nr:hypothetical protein B5F71_18245 [Bacteroides sp. An269]OUP30752.1 hypothetical protein B5F25_13615 [Bacteroides sp. An19]
MPAAGYICARKVVYLLLYRGAKEEKSSFWEDYFKNDKNPRPENTVSVRFFCMFVSRKKCCRTLQSEGSRVDKWTHPGICGTPLHGMFVDIQLKNRDAYEKIIGSSRNFVACRLCAAKDPGRISCFSEHG